MSSTPSSSSLYIGLMSGTSLDAVDAALIDFSHGCTLICATDLTLPEALREEIRALNSPCENELQRSQILDKQLGVLFADAVKKLLQQANIAADDIIAVGSHGQTLRHAPTGDWGYSLQIGDGNRIAEETGITVVADFRGRDIAAQGQGAPLVPAFHQAVFSSIHEDRAIVNIGGMANVSFLKKNGELSGFDTGPGNVLMDYWCQQRKGQAFDSCGTWAKSGTIIKPMLEAMLAEPFFQLPPPKSTGRELFDAHWLKTFIRDEFADADIQATLLELTAQSISDAISDQCDTVYLCGGGAYNSYLMQRIRELSNKPTLDTHTLGIAPEWIEATAFAWLAHQAILQLPGNAPSATGSIGPRVLGAIYSR